ncbi:MAG: hypothetical protein Q8M15_13990 [Bacteroidota bacterium]|nr:hypothetical protein [Bacteroidota bacterium]
MKKLVFSVFMFLGFSFQSFSQYEPPVPIENKTNTAENPGQQPAFYIGLGTGLFCKYGLIGLAFATRITEKTLAEVQIGSGGWGNKAGFSVTTNVKRVNGWCPSIGFNRSFGADAIELEPEVVNNGGAPFKIKTKLNLKPINVICLSMQRQFVNMRGNRFILEFGYSIPISETIVEFADQTVVYNGTIIPTSNLKFSTIQKTAFKLQNPSGLLLSLSYHFALGKYN